MMRKCDVAIIGGGAAGMAAALEARKNGAKKVIIIERADELGGILQQCIHNGFGSIVFKKDLPGPTYAYHFIKDVMATDIEVLLNTMVIDLTSERKLTLTGKHTGYTELIAGSIVLAMGCRERTRAQIMLPGSHPAGVYTAGTVQRFVNIEGWMPGRRFIILGSGDIGMIMARRLTLEGAQVIKVVELLPFLTGLRRNYVQCLQDFDIPLELSTTVNRVIGENRVEMIETVKVDSSLKSIKGTEELIPCDTLLLSVGLIPENELSMKAGVMLDPLTNGPMIDQYRATNIPGFFCAGNVVNIQDLVDHVTLAGYTAGKQAAMYASGVRPKLVSHIPLIPGKNVRALVPQMLTLPLIDKIDLQMRAGQLFDIPVEIILKKDGQKAYSVKKKYARPAEMMEIKVEPALFSGSTESRWEIDILPLEGGK